VKHQRKPASGPADPQVETPAIRQPDMIRNGHAAIPAYRAGPVASGGHPGARKRGSSLRATLRGAVPGSGASPIAHLRAPGQRIPDPLGSR